MTQLKLLREPGYVYDLLYIFCYAFNAKQYALELPDEMREEEMAYTDGVMASFGEIPEELYVFFHAIETGRAFLPTWCFSAHAKKFADAYDFPFLLRRVCEGDRLIRKLIRFYFCELDEETVAACAASFHAIAPYIKSSSYSDEEKLRLYEFFADPVPYMQTLQRELVAKEALLSAYYKDHYQKIFDAYNGTTLEQLREQLKTLQDIEGFGEGTTACVSYCLLNRHHVSFYWNEVCDVIMLGCDYVSWLNGKKEARKTPDLFALGTVLCEESRVKILRFLVEREEITRKELEKAFSFSGSTAYHHLMVMGKSGLVKSRTSGKTILYRLNKDYLADVIGVLQEML